MWQSTHVKQTRRHRKPVIADAVCLLTMTLPTGSITSLRQVVIRVCGDDLQFMRIHTCAGTGQTSVNLCIAKTTVEATLAAITRYLPDAKLAPSSSTVLSQSSAAASE